MREACVDRTLWPNVACIAHFATLPNGFVLVAKVHQDENLRTRTNLFPGLAVLGPEIGPDRPNFKSNLIPDRKFAVAIRPVPVHPTFRIAQKSATAKTTNLP